MNKNSRHKQKKIVKENVKEDIEAGVIRGREKLESRLRHWNDINKEYNLELCNDKQRAINKNEIKTKKNVEKIKGMKLIKIPTPTTRVTPQLDTILTPKTRGSRLD